MDDLAPFRGTIRHGQGEKEVEDPRLRFFLSPSTRVSRDGGGWRMYYFDWIRSKNKNLFLRFSSKRKSMGRDVFRE